MKEIENYKYSLLVLGGLSTLIYLVRRFYFGGGVCKSKARLDGKTVIITGANTGIGKETALDLAKSGARIILACRDIKKSVKAADDIRHKSGNGNVIVEYLDLASLESVKKFADKINSQEEYVHILINNAGIMSCPFWKTKNDLEMQIGVNHFGHFFLTTKLLEKLKKSAPSRIINVSSLAYEKGKINWDDLNSEKHYNAWEAYRQSKLCNVIFTRELSKRLAGTGVTSYSLHPGVVRTELGRYFVDLHGWWYRIVSLFMLPLIWIIFKTPEQGAQTTIYCAVDEELKNVSGRYYSDCKEKQLLPHAVKDEDGEKLWKISEEIIKSKVSD